MGNASQAFPRPAKTLAAFSLLQLSIENPSTTLILASLKCRLSRVCPISCRQIRHGDSRLRERPRGDGVRALGDRRAHEGGEQAAPRGSPWGATPLLPQAARRRVRLASAIWLSRRLVALLHLSALLPALNCSYFKPVAWHSNEKCILHSLGRFSHGGKKKVDSPCSVGLS